MMPYTNVQIVSVGHSGSSLLNLILGAHDDVFSVGEVYSLQKAFLYTECACGVPAFKCCFWNAVVDNYCRRTNSNRNNWQQKASLREGALAPRKKGGGLIFADPFIILGRLFSNKLFCRLIPKYRISMASGKNNNILMDAIQSVSQCGIVVDSSKNPIRLKAMMMDRPENMKIIHIVRDGRAVTRSWVKAYQFSFYEAVNQWYWRERLNQLCLLTLPQERILRIKYEDLCSHPQKICSMICRFLAIEYYAEILNYAEKPRHDFHINPRPLKKQTSIILDN